MKLKHMLFLSFLVLTCIPTVLVSFLLYQSGTALARESYTQNLTQSINIQVDYISQSIENHMLADGRFAKTSVAPALQNSTGEEQRNLLLSTFQSYLEFSGDKVTACLLLDPQGVPLYTIGESRIVQTLSQQMVARETPTQQKVQEFMLDDQTYTLGLVTPLFSNDNTHLGTLVSAYDKSHIFKSISSYYEVADTSTYLCRDDGGIINARGLADEAHDSSMRELLSTYAFEDSGIIDHSGAAVSATGYYKGIYTSPWVLVGAIDQNQIDAFANRFIMVYIFIILGILGIDIILSLYFSKRAVAPIHSLVRMMETMQTQPDHLSLDSLEKSDAKGFSETNYLRTRFLTLMRTILLVQHNFEGVYQLYQSGANDDINVDMDLKKQTIHSDKPAFEALLQEQVLPKEACVVERFTACFSPDDQILLTGMFEKMRDEHLSVTGEAELYTPHLNQKWFHSLVVPMYEDDRLSRLFVQLRDVSSFKKQERASFEEARRDTLTKLYNRTGFIHRVEELTQRETTAETHGLLFIDMNYFKMVNDNFGHSAGDALLRQIGNILLETLGEGEVVSRQGGDEFAVFLSNATQKAVEAKKALLNRRLVFPYNSDLGGFTVSPSIGVSMWRHTDTSTLDQLLQEADNDMYRAKREFKQIQNSPEE